jgi:hypothetical protein
MRVGRKDDGGRGESRMKREKEGTGKEGEE